MPARKVIMNTSRKIVSDVSSYFSVPCAVEFENSIGDIYVGMCRINGVQCLQCPPLDGKKIPVLAIAQFEWLWRIYRLRELEVRYIPIGKKIDGSPELRLSLVSSKMITRNGAGVGVECKSVNGSGGEQLALISGYPSEKFLFSKNVKDIERVNKVLHY